MHTITITVTTDHPDSVRLVEDAVDTLADTLDVGGDREWVITVSQPRKEDD